MSTPDDFKPASRFFDDKYFALGFHRCGDFTLEESRLLETYGRRLMTLQQGDEAAETDAEKQFLAVCNDQQAPASKIEKTWLKYWQLRDRKANPRLYSTPR